MGEKSRACWSLGSNISDERWEAIFGKKESKSSDIKPGNAPRDVATRGDFAVCRDSDKSLAEYRRFKNPDDRRKIVNEYFERQKQYRGKEKVNYFNAG